MSKLNVNELEANGTNSNLEVVTKGTGGVCEIKGVTNDGTLQLNPSAQNYGIKLKPPADSTGQNYTLSLPDNQMAAGKLIKVKSLTGSGTTAEAQLEFTDTPPSTYTNLQAPNINNGVFNTARIGNIPATSGGGLKLINKTEIASGQSTSDISFTGLEDNTHYLILAKDIKLASNSSYITGTFLNADGTTLTDAQNNGTQYTMWTKRRSIYGYNSYSIGSSTEFPIEGEYVVNRYTFTADLFTGADYVYLFLRGNHIARDIGTYYPAPFLMNVGLYQPTTGTRVHGIKFRSYLTSYVDPTQFLLYQYMDS